MADIKNEKSYTTAYEADFSLKKKIGMEVPLDQIFTAEKIANGDKIIEESRNNFFVRSVPDTEALLTLTRPSASKDEKAFRVITVIARNLKGDAELHGFSVIQKLCAHILEICQDDDAADKRLVLIHDLASALRIALKRCTRDAGGEVGQALVANMLAYRAQKKSLI